MQSRLVGVWVGLSAWVSTWILLTSVVVAQPEMGERRLRVGTDVATSFETPHPYAAARGTEPRLVLRHEIVEPGASYIAPHFSRMELEPGDYVIVRSPDGSRAWRYEGFGKLGLGREGSEGFWGIHITGERAIVELFSGGGGDSRTGGSIEAYGFAIDRHARGFPVDPERSVCFGDDRENAACYRDSEARIYQESRAVARLLISGNFLCTGWLLGDEGHLITNQHCIQNLSDAQNTDFEFMAEGAECEIHCPQLQCDGVIEAVNASIVRTNFDLDYTLVRLPVDVSNLYGFMQLRATGPELEERVYAPQHPVGRGKEIAVASSYPENPSGFAEIDSILEPVCQGIAQPEVGYWFDTQGGSSGSPVVAYSDHLVVALHHCRGDDFCATGDPEADDPNRGVDVRHIIADLGLMLPNKAIGDGIEIFSDDFESADFSAWSSAMP